MQDILVVSRESKHLTIGIDYLFAYNFNRKKFHVHIFNSSMFTPCSEFRVRLHVDALLFGSFKYKMVNILVIPQAYIFIWYLQLVRFISFQQILTWLLKHMLMC